MVDRVVADAPAALGGVRHSREASVDLVPRASGLHAFHGDEDAWSDLDLEPAFDGQPLYVGKAERSLSSRDLMTQFGCGTTGSSTLRRSLAALLEGELRLTAVPRNLSRPDGSAHFALDAGSDERLSVWMDQRLSLSTWTKPEGVVLDHIETQVLGRLRPPLNLDKVKESRTRVRAARRHMADTARSWRPDA